MRIAVACWTLAFLTFALTGHALPLLLVPVLTGNGNGITLPTATILIGDSVPTRHRGTATSLQSTAMFGGQFASPLLFGPLIDATSVTTGALTAAAATAAILLALTRLNAPDGDPPGPA